MKFPMVSWFSKTLVNVALSNVSSVLIKNLNQHTPDQKTLVFAHMQIYLLNVPWHNTPELSRPSRFTPVELSTLYEILRVAWIEAESLEQRVEQHLKKRREMFTSTVMLEELFRDDECMLMTVRGVRTAIEILLCTVGCGINPRIITNTEEIWNMKKQSMPDIARAITEITQMNEYSLRVTLEAVNPLEPINLDMDELIKISKFVPEQFR